MKWNIADQETPPLGELCIILFVGREPYLMFGEIARWNGAHWVRTDDHQFLGQQPAYWMPMPELPEVSE